MPRLSSHGARRFQRYFYAGITDLNHTTAGNQRVNSSLLARLPRGDISPQCGAAIHTTMPKSSRR